MHHLWLRPNHGAGSIESCSQKSLHEPNIHITTMLFIVLVQKYIYSFVLMCPCSGELWMQKLKSCLVRTQSLNILPLKPGVGKCIAIYAMLTAGSFFPAYFYPSGPFTHIFSKTSPNFFARWPWLTQVPV